MTIVQLLRAVVATEALVLVLLLAALAATASYAAARRRRDRARLARVMGSQAGGGTKTPAAELSHRFAQLPRRLRLATLADLTGPVHGTASELVLRRAGSADLIGEAAGWCRSRRWWRRLRAVRTLSLLGEGADTVPALFADPHPQVRAAAAAWAVDHPDPALADRLVDMLDDPMLRCRFAAKAALLRIGRRGVRPLVRYLTAPDVHRLASALEVAAGLAEPALLAPGLLHCRSPDPSVRSRAAEVVAAIGGAEAVASLAELLRDPDVTVRATAARGLGALGHWPAAPAVADALADPSWEVRRHAALALRRMGPAGYLYLRRALRQADPYAADMARQVLDLPYLASTP
ncbi:HEAT repeat domain-containing protein [Frankia sp. Cj3]|uniref:HEAT repeat domain-containing protein n=1 Tax=Frankia sp. Cj3 TaxID=2880976 RepID=UPI001EF491CB|nr:HEAT repeat domain-containing protein [Frankia sp. Cj3]